MKNADESAVVCRDVTKSFGTGNASVQALRGVDLDIRMGELGMLMGPSGCGKTTLLSVIAGLLDSNGGELEVLGERPSEMTNQERILFRRKNLGFVFQQFNLLPALTAAENVAVPLLAAGVNRVDAVDDATRLLVHGLRPCRRSFQAGSNSALLWAVRSSTSLGWWFAMNRHLPLMRRQVMR